MTTGRSHSQPHAHGAPRQTAPAAPDGADRAFAIGVAANACFVVVEAALGVFSGSLALLADAGHNLSDVLGLLLAWGAFRLARRAPTARRTYGLGRTTILAALLNAVLLAAVSGGIAWEAVRRLASGAGPVAGSVVMWAAGAGIVVNGGTALLFLRRRTDLNARAAFLHMASDAGVSAGVVVAGVAMRATGAAWIDPAVGLVVVAAIAAGTWGVLRESLDLVLDAVPRGVDRDAVEAYLTSLPGVTAVHDLHIWGMSTTESALTAHLVKPDPSGDDALLARICEDLARRFGIAHATLQWERGDGSHVCRLASPDVV
jgi:cobalt-zinc-cadmium efflux system protein